MTIDKITLSGVAPAGQGQGMATGILGTAAAAVIDALREDLFTIGKTHRFSRRVRIHGPGNFFG